MLKQKSTSTKIAEATEIIEKLKKKQKDIVSEIVEDLKPLVKDPGFIKSIEWTQYTPFFNDGDVCEFRVNDIEISLTEKGVEVLNTNKICSKWTQNWETDNMYGPSELADAVRNKIDIINHEEFGDLDKVFSDIKAINNFFQNSENSLKEAFGDHAKVLVTSKGLEVEEYEHD